MFLNLTITVWIGIASGLVLVAIILAIRLIYFKRKTKDKADQLTYYNAKELAYELLRERYRGHRGYYKSYQKEFHFELSLGTLRKALQPTNPTPNTRHVQRVLDDLKPGSYEVLPPMNPGRKQVA